MEKAFFSKNENVTGAITLLEDRYNEYDQVCRRIQGNTEELLKLDKYLAVSQNLFFAQGLNLTLVSNLFTDVTN